VGRGDAMTAVVLYPNDAAGEREVAAAAPLNPDLVTRRPEGGMSDDSPGAASARSIGSSRVSPR
jgi:hypothetical protein